MNEGNNVWPEMVFIDTGEIVPAERHGWASCGDRYEGQDPFRRYLDGREVVDRLPNDAPEGAVCELSWAGGSGWYRSEFRREGGQWIEQWDNSPWQLRA